jgi:Tol biopolymer transport system component
LAAACAAPDPFGDAPPQTPELFLPGLVSTPDGREYGLAFSPDGAEAWFTRSYRRGPTGIFVARFVDGAWTEPEPASFAEEGDEAPHLSGDGRRLFFSSSRRLVPGRAWSDASLWLVERTTTGWSRPTPLPNLLQPPTLADDDFEVDASGPLVLDGGTLLFSARADPEWGSDLYVAEPDGEGGYARARPLRLNSYGDEANPAVTPDGSLLVFQALRDSRGVGEQDLYVSARTATGWSEPIALPEPVNSRRNDGFPRFSPDGRRLFFASDRDGDRNGDYSIYQVDAAVVRAALGGSR